MEEGSASHGSVKSAKQVVKLRESCLIGVDIPRTTKNSRVVLYKQNKAMDYSWAGMHEGLSPTRGELEAANRLGQ